jgi:uncharacterized membrane protein
VSFEETVSTGKESVNPKGLIVIDQESMYSWVFSSLGESKVWKKEKTKNKTKQNKTKTTNKTILLFFIYLFIYLFIHSVSRVFHFAIYCQS